MVPERRPSGIKYVYSRQFLALHANWRQYLINRVCPLQIFDIDVKYIGDDMKVQVFDEDLTASDFIGACDIKLSSLCVNGGLDEWFELKFKGKASGQIHLKGTWTPTGAKAGKQ